MFSKNREPLEYSVRQLQAEIVKLKAERTLLRGQRNEAHEEAHRAKGALTALERGMKELTAERDQLAEDLDNANTRLMDVEAALVNIAVRLA